MDVSHKRTELTGGVDEEDDRVVKKVRAGTGVDYDHDSDSAAVVSSDPDATQPPQAEISIEHHDFSEPRVENGLEIQDRVAQLVSLMTRLDECPPNVLSQLDILEASDLSLTLKICMRRFIENGAPRDDGSRAPGTWDQRQQAAYQFLNQECGARFLWCNPADASALEVIARGALPLIAATSSCLFLGKLQPASWGCVFVCASMLLNGDASDETVREYAHFLRPLAKQVKATNLEDNMSHAGLAAKVAKSTSAAAIPYREEDLGE